MPYVVELRTLEALEAYRMAWHVLWLKTPSASPAQTFHWYSTFVLHGDVEPRVLVVCDDLETPLGIVPLVVRHEHQGARTVRTLTYPLLPDLGFCGPITAQPTVVLLEALRYLAAADDWDALELAGVDFERADHGRTASAFYHVELAAQTESARPHAVAEFDGSWSDYVRGRDATFVERLERLSLELAKRGQAEHVRYRPAGTMHDDDDPRWDLYGDAMMLSLGCGRDDEPSALCTPERIDLFRALHAATAACGTLDLNLLYVEGQPAAFSYNYVVDGVVTVAATGCDPAFTASEADTLLVQAMLRDSCRSGDREVDLGDRSWGAPWATRCVAPHRLRHVRRRSFTRRIFDWRERLAGRR